MSELMPLPSLNLCTIKYGDIPQEIRPKVGPILKVADEDGDGIVSGIEWKVLKPLLESSAHPKVTQFLSNFKSCFDPKECESIVCNGITLRDTLGQDEIKRMFMSALPPQKGMTVVDVQVKSISLQNFRESPKPASSVLAYRAYIEVNVTGQRNFL